MNKKFLSLMILFSLLLIVQIAFVSAEESSAASLFDSSDSGIKAWFSQWSGGVLDINITKFLFFALLSIILYSVVGLIPFIEDKFYFKLPVAVIVSFIGMAYITPQELYIVLTNTEALSLTLIALIPFIILIAMDIKLQKNEHGMWSLLFPYMLWIAYLIFMIYKLIIIRSVDEEVDKWVLVTYLCLMVVAIFWVLFGRKLFGKWMSNAEYEQGKKESYDAGRSAAIETTREHRQKIRSKIEELDVLIREATTKGEKEKVEKYEKQVKALVKNLESI